MKKAVQSTCQRDGQQPSVWQQMEQASFTATAPVPGTHYDVAIVGGGITGITTALRLQSAGQKCILIEAHNIGFGTTGGTSAHLNTFFDATYPEIASNFGTEAAKEVARAGKTALATIKKLIADHQIDCDFEEKDGYLFSTNDSESKDLSKIMEASLQAGVEVEEAEENGIPVAFKHALVFKQQAQFHPLKYITALAQAFIQAGGLICEHTLVRETDHDEDVHVLKTDRYNIKAKHLVFATHIPPGINLLSLRCAPYRSYVLGIELKDDHYPTCLSYDMQEPYHYFRTHVVDGQKLLLLGGEDHKTGHDDPAAAFNKLISYAKAHFAVQAIPYRWSSQYYVPADGLPYIGQMPAGQKHTYIATGFNGNGMQFGTLAAMIIADHILGKENEFAELFSPSRLKPIAGFTALIKENADVAYHFVADRFSAEDLEHLSELKPDEGKLVDFENKKLAVYKSKTGKITALDPVCTHAGCIVNFNAAEKSWDCPCHGGRFDLQGKVITGPASKDLEQVNLQT